MKETVDKEKTEWYPLDSSASMSTFERLKKLLLYLDSVYNFTFRWRDFDRIVSVERTDKTIGVS